MSFINLIRYSLWYLQNPPWDTGVTPPELIDYLNSHSPGRALDLGCGTGTNVITLSQSGWKAEGIDFVPFAIARARKKSQALDLSVKFHLGDVTVLDGINGPFDLVMDLGCFYGLPVPEKIKYLEQLDRVLAPDGNWFLYSFLKESPDEKDHWDIPVADLVQRRFRILSRTDGFDHGVRRSAYLILARL